MATRRSRFVIKPNIKPAGPKTSGPAPPKPKTPSINAGFESPSQDVRPQQVPLSQEDMHQPPVDDGDEKKREAVPDVEVTQPLDLLSNASSANAKLMGTEVSVGSEEIQGVKHGQQELSPANKGHVYAGLEQGGDSMNTPPNFSAVTMNSTTPSGHQHKDLQLSVTDSETLAVPSKDIANSAEVVKLADVDGHAATPSEADSSCISESVSLDPDDERGKEVSDKSEKKRKWHKTKKPRAEPLPSREKSPDRQKMKMGDLLLWNPQQNYFPRKSKKKTAPKSEMRPVSPTPSVTADDDSESTNQSASLPAPQIMIGPDGSIVLNTESLLVNTQKEDTKPREIIEEDEDDRYLNTNSYRKYQRTKLWTERETEIFFMGLSMCGSDFSLMANLLTNRTRRELKKKFEREEKRNRELIDKALSNWRQYDLTPFQKFAMEDKKEKKPMKKEAATDKKAEKTTKKRGRKKKKKESEEEEDDWGEECNREDEENQNLEVGSEDSVNSPIVKNKSKVKKVKTEANNQRKSKLADQNIQESTAEQVPKFEDFIDLDNPRMTTKPTKTYSRLSPEKRTMHQPTVTPGPGASFSASSNIIQAIPGSTQVQIEMEGVQNPVQGVLIPSHMVPQIAPQLGIHGNPAGMQVLLVQEETESGSMVHVYVIPEGSTASAVAGAAGPSSHPAFTSPIPSPHPSASVQSPGAASPFHSSCNSHPLASVCSPPPKSPFHSPSPLHYPSSGEPPQRAYHQPHSSSQQNLNPQSTPTRPYSESFTGQNQDGEVGMPPLLPSVNMQEKSDLVQTNRGVVCVPPHSQSADCLASLNPSTSVQLHAQDIDPSAPEATASIAHGYIPDVVVIAVQETASRSADSSEPCISSDVDVAYSNNLDDDCMIIDADRPQSRFDKSSISCL